MTRAESAIDTRDPRESRRYAEREVSQHRSESGLDPEEFRVDLERIRFSPYFGRLSDVTQVVPQSGVGPVMHNRLTHTLKVSAVGRVIAANLAALAAGASEDTGSAGATIVELGGCDTNVVQAAAHAHDLGHPPFGHLGERVLDRLARDRLGLAEGFEGNAQSFRILTRLDTLGRDFPGLNLTAATRAATLKYPWTRVAWRGTGLGEMPLSERPRGIGADPDRPEKFSAYASDADEMAEALAAFPRIGTGVQTVECAVMDLADDIAYAVHDLDDFARAGVLQRSSVIGELGTWLVDAAELSRLDERQLLSDAGEPGRSLELLWRGIVVKDTWIADRDTFADAVRHVNEEVSDSLLATPYDGGIRSERAVSGFTRRWIEHLRTSIVVDAQPHVRGGHVRLDRRAWHEVAVLKFIHAHFVLERPGIAQPQRGQARVIEGLVLGFDAWLTDAADAPRVPRKLAEWVEEATAEVFALRRDRPDLLIGETNDAALRRQGRARAILDYVSSFTDQQAVTTHRELAGA